MNATRIEFRLLGFRPSDNIAIAREAERLGYHSLRSAEAYGSDRQILERIPAGRWATLEMLRAPQFSFRRQRVITFMATFWWWMAAGLEGRMR